MTVDAVRGRPRKLPRQPARLGAVYTPKPVAKWLAAEVVRRLPTGAPRLVLDPACGDGALLAAVAEQDAGIKLVGLDIDKQAAAAARARLDQAFITAADALTTPWTAVGGPFLGVIANPPWGAEVLHSRRQLAASGYSLASGQFDSYELFLERAIAQLPVGGVAGFLIPDSLLLPEHEALRRLLVKRTRLELFIRLGEGIFDDVYRGTIAVVLVVGEASADHAVRCCRVRKADRRALLGGTTSLADIVSRHGHAVRQANFAAHEAALDLDTTEAERTTMVRMSQQPTVWVPWLRAFRGVEIGKSGRVTVCSRCQVARPVRRNIAGANECDSCGAAVHADRDAQMICRPLEGGPSSPDWVPVLAGEDVQRYAITPRREIRLGVRGIRYKDAAIFTPPKLLVRKTGVGLHASLDESGAMTTQTVFHFLPTPAAPPFALHYVLGVLNSRIMLAYHLKRHGDVEWRSHPYVTPKLLSSLPVPLPTHGTQRWRQAIAISEAVHHMLVACSEDKRKADLHIERLVAGLFDFSEAECEWVDDVLGQAQQLQPIAALRLQSPDEISPLLAAPSRDTGRQANIVHPRRRRGRMSVDGQPSGSAER